LIFLLGCGFHSGGGGDDDDADDNRIVAGGSDSRIAATKRTWTDYPAAVLKDEDLGNSS
jgi:hypothetical protein